MIKGVLKTEAQYRALKIDSSSSLKDFSMSRLKYYKKYILNEEQEDDDNRATLMGRVVETLLLEPQEFDNRFFMSSCWNVPTGLMLAFVEALYKNTIAATDEEGNVSKSFEERSREAYVESGFKIAYDAVLKKFIDSDAEIYFREILEVRSKKLSVVTVEDVSVAENIVGELKRNPVTSEVVNLINSVRHQVYNQFQIENYSVDGHLFKSMIDKIVIDHELKTIQVYDLKCTWSVENFYEEYYLYRRAYIQAFLYYKAAIELMNNVEELRGYRVEQPKFIVCDSNGVYHPLIYVTTDKSLENAYNGFEYKGKKYPGVGNLIKDLSWAIETNNWKVSRENYLNNGLVKIEY